MCSNIYLPFRSSFVLFFSPSNPLYINSLLLAVPSGTCLSHSGCDNILLEGNTGLE